MERRKLFIFTMYFFTLLGTDQRREADKYLLPRSALGTMLALSMLRLMRNWRCDWGDEMVKTGL